MRGSPAGIFLEKLEVFTKKKNHSALVSQVELLEFDEAGGSLAAGALS